MEICIVPLFTANTIWKSFLELKKNLDVSVSNFYALVPGHYMYIEASQPRRQADYAQLQSPFYSSPTGGCLSFYYSMNGAQMGTLNVIFKQTGSTDKKLWTKSGNQGTKWNLANVLIPPSSKYAIVFEGIVGSGYKSDIAIDDISVKTGACPVSG